MTTFAQKKAILVVQFGTTNDEGRKASLDVIFKDIKDSCAQYEVREAYSAPRVRKGLLKKGIKKDSAVDALLRLHLDGYDEVYVQPTFILDGVEMNMLRDDVASVSRFFKKIEVGMPLLYNLEDFKTARDILAKREAGKKEAVLYVGHGNAFASTGAYTMLGDMMQKDGNVFVGTIEGWPDLDTSVGAINNRKFKSVTVIPLLLACGVHVHEDIEGEWRPALEKKGFKVDIYAHGLGENKEFRDFIIAHLKTLLTR